ncbi:MAG: phosphatidylserine/phosphatidylglycerophosphate/cardiolipin synthase family protein, partial [Bacteroidota bacterium]|nr:phosphatidylserine/phosphatidylglycerophosphate/cardiolipin synthase family protein [Bacteroidota bacterium]
MEYLVLDDPLKFYTLLLADIGRAKDYIFLETYKFANDDMGIKFRDALTIKAKEGVKVKILIDSWGKGPISESFFEKLINYGGEVKFFEKIKLNTDIFTRGHRRDHRKIIVIDGQFSYLGSMNITGYNLNWRELAIRIHNDEMATLFKTCFTQNFEAFNPYNITNKVLYSKTLRYDDFELIRDLPSGKLQRLKKKYYQLIRTSKTSVLIETPYFLPGFMLRKAMMEAAKRGVDVKVIMPKNSDVGMIDILRNKYFGILHKNNVKLLFYTPHNLHAKLLMIDNRIFSISSANFDYRSFRYQYEIALLGKEPSVLDQLLDHVADTLKYSEPFDYEQWLRRPLIQKIMEQILVPLRH